MLHSVLHSHSDDNLVNRRLRLLPTTSAMVFSTCTRRHNSWQISDIGTSMISTTSKTTGAIAARTTSGIGSNGKLAGKSRGLDVGVPGPTPDSQHQPERGDHQV